MLKEYSSEEEDKVYVELSNLPSDSKILGFISDYYLLRQQVKDCNQGG